jgi:predicted transcriptional regulator
MTEQIDSIGNKVVRIPIVELKEKMVESLSGMEERPNCSEAKERITRVLENIERLKLNEIPKEQFKDIIRYVEVFLKIEDGQEIVIYDLEDDKNIRSNKEITTPDFCKLVAPFIREWGIDLDKFISLQYIEENTFSIPNEIWSNRMMIPEDFKKKIPLYLMAYDMSNHPLPSYLSSIDTEIVDREYIWEDFISKGQVIELTSKPKQGKTRFAVALASKISHGDTFIGRKTTKGKCLLFLMEDNVIETNRRFWEFGANRDNIIIFNYPLADIFDLRSSLNRLKDRGESIDFIVIDTYVKFTGVKDINNYSENVNALTGLTTLAKEYNLGILIIHHARKSKSEGEETGDESTGSSSIFGSVDGLLNISRYDKDTNEMVLKSNLRYSKPVKDMIYDLNNPSECKSLEAIEEKSRESEVLELLEIGEEYKGAELIEILEKGLELSSKTIQKLLKSMTDKGLIIRKKDTERTHGYIYWKE